MDYDAIRSQQKRGLAEQIANLRSYVEKMQKAQRAAEKAMDMCAEFFLFSRRAWYEHAGSRSVAQFDCVRDAHW